MLHNAVIILRNLMLHILAYRCYDWKFGVYFRCAYPIGLCTLRWLFDLNGASNMMYFSPPLFLLQVFGLISDKLAHIGDSLLNNAETMYTRN